MKRHRFKEWVLATRPWSFPASLMPVIVGGAYVYWISCSASSEGMNVNWMNFLLSVLAIVLLQASGNLWSDLNDYRCGVDTSENYSVKILTSGEFSVKEVLCLSAGLFVTAVAVGGILLMLSGPLTLLFGAAGLLLLVFYPKLKYHAFGDADIFVAYAMLPLLGTSYVMTGSIVWPIVWLTLPVGLITVAILHVNNTRDIESDRRAGISTLAMTVGYSIAKPIYIFEIVLPFLCVGIFILCGVLPVTSVVAFFAFLPAINNVRTMNASTASDVSAIVSLDAATAKLQLIFSLLLSISLFAAVLI